MLRNTFIFWFCGCFYARSQSRSKTAAGFFLFATVAVVRTLVAWEVGAQQGLDVLEQPMHRRGDEPPAQATRFLAAKPLGELLVSVGRLELSARVSESAFKLEVS